MPLAYAQSLGDGVTRVFSVPFPYISKTHVQVRVEGAIVPYSWLSETSIQLATAPAVNAVVDRRRVTPRDTLLVDFVDGSTLVESDLDLSALQVFYLAQEAFDLGEASLGVTEDGSFSALNRRISNVLNPIHAQDVATKNFVETGVTSQVAIAIQKANEAANSAGQSEASATNSAQQAAAALASKNAAAGSATAAAQSEANAIANKNQTQLDRAATAADRVQTGLDREASAASAAAAAQSAQDAALFDPATYYTKNESDTKYYTKYAVDTLLADPWALQPIGAFVWADDGTVGFAAPPKDKAYRYVELTAGLTASGAYNEGILSTETVSGSAPAISATAVVNLAGSPFNGRTIRLLNTERRFLRPGSQGALEDSQNLSHGHGVNDPGHVHGGVQNGQASTGRSTSVDQPPAVFSFGNTWGATTGISIQASGGNEARPRNIGIRLYRRIK